MLAGLVSAGSNIASDFDVIVGNDTISFVADVQNLGSAEMKQVWVQVNIFDEDKVASFVMKKNMVFASVESYSKQVPGSDVRELALPNVVQTVPAGGKARITVLVNKSALKMLPGNYGAEAVIYFDGANVHEEKRFNIGRQDIRVLNSSSVFLQNEVNKFYFDLYNDWNFKAINAHLDVDIIDKAGKVVNTLNSFNFYIEQRARRQVMVYFNTGKAAVGEYGANVTVYHEGGNSSWVVPLYVVAANGTNVSRDSGGGKYFKFDLDFFIYAFIVILVVLFIGEIVYLFVFGRQRKGGRRIRRMRR